MFGSLFNLVKDVGTIVTAPVEAVVDIVAKPVHEVAKVVEELAKDVKDAVKD